MASSYFFSLTLLPPAVYTLCVEGAFLLTARRPDHFFFAPRWSSHLDFVVSAINFSILLDLYRKLCRYQNYRPPLPPCSASDRWSPIPAIQVGALIGPPTITLRLPDPWSFYYAHFSFLKILFCFPFRSRFYRVMHACVSLPSFPVGRRLFFSLSVFFLEASLGFFFNRGKTP